MAHQSLSRFSTALPAGASTIMPKVTRMPRIQGFPPPDLGISGDPVELLHVVGIALNPPCDVTPQSVDAQVSGLTDHTIRRDFQYTFRSEDFPCSERD